MACQRAASKARSSGRAPFIQNTVRQYWIYVPAQYDPAKPAALMVFQDGHQYVALDRDYRVPTVFDNLIAAKTMPVTIGVFVNPGHAGEELPKDPWRSSNRSNEYDVLTDQYARFLIDELLPEIARRYPVLPRSGAARDRRRQLRRDLRVHRRLGAA